jgi:hypothetical protein
VFLALVFYLHLGNENQVPLQNLNPVLVFEHHKCSLLFVQGYPVKRKLLEGGGRLHEEASEQCLFVTTLSQ